jgi:hypothetical protein
VPAEDDDLGSRVWGLLAESRDLLEGCREAIRMLRETVRRSRELRDAKNPENPGADR